MHTQLMKSSTIAILGAVILVGGASLLSSRGSATTLDAGVPVHNVTINNGIQIITVSAMGGYSPKKSVAKAGIPTVLRFNTHGTFDCSSTVHIPSMGISKNLPSSGATEVDLGSPKVATLQGVCGMGMYSFEIDFKG